MTTHTDSTLDDDRAVKSAAMASRLHADQDILASSLLGAAVDEGSSGVATIPSLVDGIDGAHARIERGLGEAARGDVIPLKNLA